MMNRGVILLPVLLMLTACNDKVSVETVRSMAVSPNDPRRMGEVLDSRHVCDKTTWMLVSDNDGGGHVTYQCDMAVAKPQSLFAQQLESWKEYSKRTLADAVTGNKALKAAAREKKEREAPLLEEANRLFEQLQVSGDLDRYKALAKHAPVDNPSLEGVTVFLASEQGQSWLATYPESEEVLASVKAVTQAVSQSGVATTSTNIDLCTAPAMLVLAPILTQRDVKKTLIECDITADDRYEAEVTSADTKVSDAMARMKNVDRDFRLAGVKETLSWTIAVKGKPVLKTHTLTLDVREGDTPRQASQPMELKGSNFVAVLSGKWGAVHQKALTMAMGKLVQ